MQALLQLPATELRDRLARGALRAVELARACLAQIEAREDAVRAWARLDPEHVLKQAQALDAQRAAGRPIGPLHGLPVGIDDRIDTAGMATESGSPLEAGRMPSRDAFVVLRLRQAGAILMGKTATAELGFGAAERTRNPQDPACSPGGPASGAAAAVAAGMVPLAVGVGSPIPPAAHCGIVGFAPSFGAVPRSGMLSPAPTLDRAGIFAATIEGAALLAEPLFGWDADDPETTLAPPPPLLATAGAAPPVRPDLAFVRQPCWEEAEADTRAAFAELATALGEACEEVALPPPFADAARLHERVRLAEMARSLYRHETRGGERLSPALRAALAEGGRILARDYLAARDAARALGAGLEAIFDRFDVIVTPATAGPAPQGAQAGGDDGFARLWTFCGLPAVSLPLLQAANGLPLGLQLVGRRGNDARLLRTARWLAGRLAAADEPEAERGAAG